MRLRRALALLGLTLALGIALGRIADAAPVKWTPAVASVFDARAERLLACWPNRGAALRPGALVVAHRTIPCGTKVRVCYRRRCVTATVRDHGPNVAGRDVDLDELVARAVRMPYGVELVRLRVIDRRRELSTASSTAARRARAAHSPRPRGRVEARRRSCRHHRQPYDDGDTSLTDSWRRRGLPPTLEALPALRNR